MSASSMKRGPPPVSSILWNWPAAAFRKVNCSSAFFAISSNWIGDGAAAGTAIAMAPKMTRARTNTSFSLLRVSTIKSSRRVCDMEMRKCTNPNEKGRLLAYPYARAVCGRADPLVRGWPPGQPAIVPMNSCAILETHLPWKFPHHFYVAHPFTPVRS